MIQRVLFFTIAALFWSTSFFGQKDSATRSFFAVKTDLVFLGMNISGKPAYSLIVEKGISKRSSVQLKVEYTTAIYPDSYRYVLLPEYKFFLNKKQSFKGFYTGGYLKYWYQERWYYYSENHKQHITEKDNGYGAGFIFGYQTYVKKHLTIDFLIGLGARFFTQQLLDIPSNLSFYPHYPMYPNTVLPDGRIAINIGYKF